MSRILKTIIRPFIMRRLMALQEERDRIEVAIQRARRAKQAVSGLYAHAKATQAACARLERWL